MPDSLKQMLDGRSFESKLQLPLMVLAVVLVVSFAASFLFVSLLSSNTHTLAYEDLPGLDFVLQADRDLYQAQMAERSLATMEPGTAAFNDMASFYLENIDQAQSRILQFRDLMEIPEIKAQGDEFLRLIDQWKVEAEQIKTLYSSGYESDRQAAMALSFGSGLKSFESVRVILDEITGPVIKQAYENTEASDLISWLARGQQLLTLALGLVVCYLVMRHFPPVITAPIVAMLEAIKGVTESSDFSRRAPVTTKDEIGALAEHFNRLMTSVEESIRDCTNVVEYLAEGEFQTMSAERYRGHLKNLAVSINSTSHSVSAAMKDINCITNELADGNFEVLEKTSEDALKGEFGATVTNANRAKQAIRGVIRSTDVALKKVAAGEVTEPIEANFPGELQGLKTGVNQTLVALNDVFKAIEAMMGCLADGDFSHADQMMAGGKLPGRYGLIIESVEAAMAQLDSAIQDIAGVMSKVAEGQLSSRVESTMKGDLDRLKVNINSSLDQIRRINHLISASLSQLAEGNLAMRVEGDFPGDFASLRSDIDATVANLTSMIGQIQDSSGEVLMASQQLDQGSSDISNRTEQQAAAVEETMASLEHIREAGVKNIEEVGQVVRVSKATESAALEGQATMQKVVGSVQDISDSSNKIGSIIQAIDGIAFQTNLLALNAAVEAARAGESGRGFAVVAGEVRTLARRSTDAAREIKELVNEIIERVAIGTEVAEGSGDVLRRVVESFNQVNQGVERIANVIRDQSGSIGEVASAMKTIETNIQATAAVAEESAASCKVMSEQASGLKHLTTAFNV